MAQQAKKIKAKKGAKAGDGNLIAWIVAPVIGVVALPTLLLLVVGMAPTLVAFFIVDRHPAKYSSRTVGYLNFAGCLPYALDLWRTGGVWDFGVLLEIIGDPFSLLIMYSTAAFGWMILFMTPPIVAAYLSVTSDLRETNFKTRQEELVEHWGRNVRNRALGVEMEADDSEPERAEEPADETSAPA